MAASKKISLTEEELVHALKTRETIAVKALYDMYSASLLGIITRIIQNHPEVCADLLQDTFVKIWNSANSYDSTKGRLFTWMMNIARNLAIDKLRSKEFRNSTKNRDIENNVDFIDTQKKIIFNADTVGIKDLVNALKPEFISVLEMVYFQGYTHVEAAEILKLPLGTVKTRIRMAIMELRKHFN